MLNINLFRPLRHRHTSPTSHQQNGPLSFPYPIPPPSLSIPFYKPLHLQHSTPTNPTPRPSCQQAAEGRRKVSPSLPNPSNNLDKLPTPHPHNRPRNRPLPPILHPRLNNPHPHIPRLTRVPASTPRRRSSLSLSDRPPRPSRPNPIRYIRPTRRPFALPSSRPGTREGVLRSAC